MGPVLSQWFLGRRVRARGGDLRMKKRGWNDGGEGPHPRKVGCFWKLKRQRNRFFLKASRTVATLLTTWF